MTKNQQIQNIKKFQLKTENHRKNNLKDHLLLGEEAGRGASLSTFRVYSGLQHSSNFERIERSFLLFSSDILTHFNAFCLWLYNSRYLPLLYWLSCLTRLYWLFNSSQVLRFMCKEIEEFNQLFLRNQSGNHIWVMVWFRYFFKLIK